MAAYLDDSQISWSAVGLLTYLVVNDLLDFDDVETLLLNRAVGVWHPEDRGDFDDAWSQLLARGYVEQDNAGRWHVYTEVSEEGDA